MGTNTTELSQLMFEIFFSQKQYFLPTFLQRRIIKVDYTYQKYKTMLQNFIWTLNFHLNVHFKVNLLSFNFDPPVGVLWIMRKVWRVSRVRKYFPQYFLRYVTCATHVFNKSLSGPVCGDESTGLNLSECNDRLNDSKRRKLKNRSIECYF